ncbi:MAG TPA: hypothetical protein VGM26_12160 [Rhizomicrobium sp.]|jgi:hypothetical protein
MKSFIIVTAMLAFACGQAVAQPNQQSSDRGAAATQGESAMSRPAVGMGSKTMESCRTDTQKFCATASDYVRKECLVKNWDVITSDCQDALGKPFDGAAPHHE